MRSILLDDADFVVLDSNRTLRNGSVYIEGDTIVDVGPSKSISGAHATEERVDCKGQIVIPGLINAHNHLYEIASRGLGKDYSMQDWITKVVYPVNQLLTADDYYHLELLGCADAARNGTTAIVEMMTSFARFHADKGISAFGDFGMRGAVARSSSNRSKLSESENRDAKEDLSASRRFLEAGTRNGLVKPWLGPSMLVTCEPAMISQLKKMANDFGTKFHIHLGETFDLVSEARKQGYLGEISMANAYNILDENTVIAHAVWATAAELEILGRSGSQVVHNPNSNQVLADGVAPVSRMLGAGITVGLGTDGPASNDSLDLIAEMKSCVLMSRVTSLNPRSLSAKNAFTMATLNGAKILGVDNLGQIRKGAKADLACIRIRGNPSFSPVYDPIEALVYFGSGRDVSRTIINGRTVYQEGSFPTFDLEKSTSKLNNIAEKVRAELKLT